ncbi:putative F-box protein At5g62660 [Bidens hawaiensis]|uniref:putative F-box protein At5g62660 n=1 Tax=Bidens hawaiensis TaxID=980011 RepID=UPI0040496B43
MKLLPVKSLIRFRSVSKTWKSWIDSSSFVHTYTRKQTPHVLVSCNAPLLVGYNAPLYKQTFISVPDDDSFSLKQVTLPSFHNNLEFIGSSHGLLCFHKPSFSSAIWDTAVIWNPCIRRAFQILVPAPAPTRHSTYYTTVLGFGVCRVTNDPKIVKIFYNRVVGVFQVDLYTLSTRAWRSLSLSESDKLPRKSVRFPFLTRTSYSVAIDGFVYWLATDETTVRRLIVSFDMTSEEFGEVSLPDRLARSQHKLHMSKLGGSLVLLEHVDEPDRLVYSVWTMEGGSGLFTQLYTFNYVNTPENVTVLGFRLRGDAIIEITDNGITELVVYEWLSKPINNLGFSGSCEFFSACTRTWKHCFFMIIQILHLILKRFEIIRFDQLKDFYIFDDKSGQKVGDSKPLKRIELLKLKLIVSFDMTSEEFGEVSLPDRLARSQHKLHMSKLGGSLVLSERVYEPDRLVYSVWTMEGGPGLFTQLYTFNVNAPKNVTILGFGLRGDAIIEITDNGITELVVYERLSKRINNLGFRGCCQLFSAHPYMETLFLHDHPDLTFNTEALQNN